MSKIADIYTKGVRSNLKPLFANWEPGRSLKLGDYGLVVGDSFIYVGNVSDMGIEFDIRKDDTKDTKTFSTQGATEIIFNAKGSISSDGIANANANLKIDFSNEEAVFFNAAECSYDMIRDKSALGKNIMDNSDWKRKWSVVTDIITAKATTIIVSGGKSSSIVLEATGNVDRIDLADGSIKFGIGHSKNVGYSVTAKEGLMPLIGLSKVKRKFPIIGRSDFRPLAKNMFNEDYISAIESEEDILTELSKDDLYFGQLE